MKRLLALLLFFAAQKLAAQAITKLTFTWSYSYTTIPVCTPSVTTYCIHHFDLTEGSSPIASIPATTATTYVYYLTPLPSSGSHTYNLVAVEVATGTSTMTSPPATLTTTVPAPPATPAGFTAVPQ